MSSGKLVLLIVGIVVAVIVVVAVLVGVIGAIEEGSKDAPTGRTGQSTATRSGRSTESSPAVKPSAGPSADPATEVYCDAFFTMIEDWPDDGEFSTESDFMQALADIEVVNNAATPEIKGLWDEWVTLLEEEGELTFTDSPYFTDEEQARYDELIAKSESIWEKIVDQTWETCGL
jgi:hypothetical protein